MTEKLAPVPNFSVLPTGFIRTKLSLVLWHRSAGAGIPMQ
jgi:hypothetical protein